MYKPTTTASAVLALAAATGVSAADFSAWAFGNMFAVGPPASGAAHITKATWSVVPPATPSDATDEKSDPPFLSLWIGVSDSVSDESTALVQPLLNWSPDQESQWPASFAWEIRIADGGGGFAAGQVAQPYVAVPKDTQIDFEITATSDKKTTQKVWINNKIVSQQDDDAGWLPTYLYSSNECYQNTCGSVAGYTWSNITITLSAADEAFGDTLSLTGAAGALTTADGGMTWTGDVEVDADHFPAAN
ncbi:hypothetical protein SLS58_010666 [Diplodia intermedia]|uniref:Uncharacterized protein n=1 Tax=Diplodia intermedia TaxID=856260 RepID=A0ABR3T4M3_9PEZI